MFYTNFEDELTAQPLTEGFTGKYGNHESHYAKLRKIVMDNANHITIQRLYTNHLITASELEELDRILFAQSGLATHEEFKDVLGERPLGVFIRSILGLDSNSAKNAFSSFLGNGSLTSVQIEFINQLIEQFTRHGQLDPDMLFEQPYTRFHESGVAGVFPLHADKLISIVKQTNGNALLG